MGWSYLTMDSENNFIFPILRSCNSLKEFKMKMMISGRYYHKNDYISDLIKILFDDSIIEDDKLIKKICDLLKTSTDIEEINKYITNKTLYATYFLLTFEKCKDNLVILSNKQNMFINRFVLFSQLVHHFDCTFISNLRDSEGNNLLMIFIRLNKLDVMYDMLERAASSRYAKLDSIVKQKYGFDLLFKMINEFNCDPNIKNKYGCSFSDYFSDDFFLKM